MDAAFLGGCVNGLYLKLWRLNFALKSLKEIACHNSWGKFPFLG